MPGATVPGQVAAGTSHTGTLLLSDLGWARPATNGKLGPAPRRMTDVVQPGDVVMVEPAAPVATKAAAGASQVTARLVADRPAVDHLVLRQIPLVQGALVSLDPTTGRVLAMVGGWSFEPASSTARPRRSGSRDRASSRSST